MDWLKRRRVLLGSSLAKPIAPLELRELWRTTIPGHKANVFICDASSGSLFAMRRRPRAGTPSEDASSRLVAHREGRPGAVGRQLSATRQTNMARRRSSR
jgi:hypothetical protein